MFDKLSLASSIGFPSLVYLAFLLIDSSSFGSKDLYAPVGMFDKLSLALSIVPSLVYLAFLLSVSSSSGFKVIYASVGIFDK